MKSKCFHTITLKKLWLHFSNNCLIENCWSAVVFERSSWNRETLFANILSTKSISTIILCTIQPVNLLEQKTNNAEFPFIWHLTLLTTPKNKFVWELNCPELQNTWKKIIQVIAEILPDAYALFQILEYNKILKCR